MKELKLTRHFIENWRARVDGEPEPGMVNEIIRQSVRVVKGRKGPGRRAGYGNSLTVYCHFGLAVAITVDHFSGSVVSVLSWRNMPDGAWTWDA